MSVHSFRRREGVTIPCARCGADVAGVYFGRAAGNTIGPCPECGVAVDRYRAIAALLHATLKRAGLHHSDVDGPNAPGVDLLAMTVDPTTGEWIEPGAWDFEWFEEEPTAPAGNVLEFPDTGR